MKRLITYSCVLYVLSVGAQAAPHVQDSVIEFDDSDWYQVQRSSDYHTICEGIGSCEAGPGIYNVINLTTGQRWDGVRVDGASDANPNPDAGNNTTTGAYTISGFTISWPDNGWYQLQRQNNYETVCEGGNHCRVTTGTYILINLTTGERFENIRVGGGHDADPSDVPDADDVTTPVTENATEDFRIEGTHLSFLTNAWFEVQNAGDYSHVCSGVSQCELIANQEYIVINHDTGTRTSITTFASTDAGDSSSSISELVFTLPADIGSATLAPEGISLAVHNDTTAELNWTRPPYSAGISVNEIWRDGFLLEEIPGGGNSYVDNSRIPGQSHVYHIVAINRFGRATTRFDAINTLTAYPESLVLAEGALPLSLQNELKGFFHLINGVAIENTISLLKQLDASPESFDLAFDVAEPDRYSDRTIYKYTCNGGGSIAFYGDRSSAFTSANIRSTIADDCSFGPHFLNGRITPTQSYSSEGVSTSRINFYYLSYKNSNNNSELSLYIAEAPFNYESEDGEGIVAQILSYNDGELSYYHNNYDDERYLGRRSMQITTGNIEATAEALDGIFGMSSRMRTDIPFSLANARGKPEVGKLVLYSRHVGNRTIAIDADTGNSDTFYIHVTDNNRMTSYVVNWSDDYRIDSIDP